MLNLPPTVKIFVAREPVDMRKSFTGLSAVICDVIDQDPQSGHLFVFFNKRKNLSKILWWDQSGYTLVYKRLEHGRFAFFDQANGGSCSYPMKSSELALILEGIDLRDAKRRLLHDDVHRS